MTVQSGTYVSGLTGASECASRLPVSRVASVQRGLQSASAVDRSQLRLLQSRCGTQQRRP